MANYQQIARDTLMLFVSHGPLKYSQYQYPIYLFLAEKTEDRVPSEPLKHVETLIRVKRNGFMKIIIDH